MNITFLTIDGSEICLDGTKPIVTQKPRYSTDTVEAKRFRPKLIGNSTSFLSNILEFITDPDWKSQYDAEDRCFRFNGELISAPQNKEEEEMVDKLLWDYMMKKAANNVSYIIENSKQMKTFTSTITHQIEYGHQPPRRWSTIFQIWSPTIPRMFNHHRQEGHQPSKIWS